LVEGHPGLYLVGLAFLHSVSSSMIPGVGRDAARIVRTIALNAETAPTSCE
jgi:hypothetical protein